MKNLLVINLILCSLFLVGCSKQEVISEIKNQSQDSIGSGNLETSSGITEKTLTGIISESGSLETTKYVNKDFSINFGSKYSIRDDNKSIYFKNRDVKKDQYSKDVTTYYDYVFEFSPAINSGDVINSLKNVSLSKNPLPTKINGFSAIEYVENGECNYPTLIVFGENFNYKLVPICYGEDKENDTFKYLEGIAKSIEEIHSK
ncbi:MAG: hypothetical protein PHE25_05345 [Candidatus Gracilibacteria bacterium]|nr:hypothetical protein [Candidatus Gracilibacteria bacterium]